METVPDKISFPGTEEEIAKLWDRIDAFPNQLKRTEGKPEYTFYDGPPFATGLPHYGHILAGTIKDTVTRYASQTGHHVIRRFGWDCHGLPIEFEIDKELGVKTRDDVLKMGIPKYNAACRGIVMRYSSEWERIVKRLGRWIDFKNDYKTLDLSFMESVWWVFKQIYEKKVNEQPMVYRKFKVMPYSTACTTPLSNFEVNLAYKDVDDPAIVVHFPLEDEPDTSIVAWTTTPWTLPSNLAVCVNPTFDYVKVYDKTTKTHYIILEKRLVELYKIPADSKEFNMQNNDMFEVKGRYKGADLKGKKYKPLFDYFESYRQKGAFQVLVDSYVTDDSGTGIVHMAPAFGEDDYRVCDKAGIIKEEDIVCPVDASGIFTAEVKDFAGKHVKAADKDIIKHLKTSGRLVKAGTINHSYPFCWRSDTPLIYKAIPCWFIRVEAVKDQLIANNKQSYWVPEYVQEKRFANWLADARDWAVSRNRFWGTPIPIWISEDGLERRCIGSVAELEELTGQKITDLHRESIDHLTIPSQQGKGVLRRVDEVFDCWFESGSMPYAQSHYPFENKDLFEKGFPADFIAEGIDQTRGWFYTLLVISTILYNKPPFKNLIVNGLVLAADGKKMSKRLKNYPDPMKVVEEYGADALRLYLINSPVVRGEQLKFVEKGVKDILKDVFLPWFNAFRFFSESVIKYNLQPGMQFKPDTKLALSSTNIMDKWILAATNGLIQFVRQEMKAYRLYTVIPRLVQFIEQLTNWYVRLNRRRLKGSEGLQDNQAALAVFYEVLFTVTKAMSPFTPYLTEYFYQHLRKVIPENEREDSVHYLDFPVEVSEALNPRIVEAVGRMQAVVQLGRQARDRKNLPIKFPLTKFTVIHKDPQYLKDIEGLKSYILGELNIKELALTSDDSSVSTTAKPDFVSLGKRLKKDLGKVQAAIKALTHEQIVKFQAEGKIELAGHVITSEEMFIIREYKGDATKVEAAWDNDVLTLLDLQVDEQNVQEGQAREVINRIQKLRKKIGIVPTDPIEIFVEANGAFQKVVSDQMEFIRKNTGVPVSPLSKKSKYSSSLAQETYDISGSEVKIHLCRLDFGFSEKLKKKCGDDQVYEDVKTMVASRDYSTLLKQFQEKGKITFNLNGKDIELVFGEDVFPSVIEASTK